MRCAGLHRITAAQAAAAVVAVSNMLFNAIHASLPAGNEKVPEVLQHVFQYLELLKSKDGITQELYDDNAALRRLAFDYRVKPEAFSYTSNIAHLLHHYPVEHVLQVADGVPLKFDEAAIRAALDALAPEALMCMWVSHKHDASGMGIEPWCAGRLPFGVWPCTLCCLRGVHLPACSSWVADSALMAAYHRVRKPHGCHAICTACNLCVRPQLRRQPHALRSHLKLADIAAGTSSSTAAPSCHRGGCSALPALAPTPRCNCPL